MLAQNFKTPADLKITDADFDALFKVLGMLERGDLTYHDGENVKAWKGHEMPRHFNMVTWDCLADCGTVCCIGGTAEYVGGFQKAHFHSSENPQLRDLLGIGGSLRLLELRGISVEQASIALRNYLTNGEARWAEALAG